MKHCVNCGTSLEGYNNRAKYCRAQECQRARYRKNKENWVKDNPEHWKKMQRRYNAKYHRLHRAPRLRIVIDENRCLPIRRSHA